LFTTILLRIVSIFALALGLISAQPYRVSTIVSGIPRLDNFPALEVSLGHIGGVATDQTGSLYFSSLRGCVFKLDSSGQARRVAGTCQGGDSGDGGPATLAQLGLPGALAVDSQGNLYIVDSRACRIRKVSTSGVISTVAGNGQCRLSVSQGGSLTSASLSDPGAIAVDNAGDIFIAEADQIRKLSPSGQLTPVIVGLAFVGGLAVDGAGDLYIGASSQVYKLTGTETATISPPNSFGLISGLAIDSAGNVLVADGAIESIHPDGSVHQIAGSACCSYSASNTSGGGTGGVAVDAYGNIYVAVPLGDVVRKISPQGAISDIAGTDSPTFVGDNGAAFDAQLSSPEAVTVDRLGNVYVADFFNSRVRKITPRGLITTVAGNGTAGLSGDGGPAANAQLNGPDGLAIDAAGNLFIAEYNNFRVRKVSPDGMIATVAGSLNCCDPGDGGLATQAFVPLPHGIALDQAGNLYIAEWPDSRIRKVTPSGIISTYAGVGTRGYSGDGGPAINAQLNFPWGLAVDRNGNLYLADNQNLRLRKITPDGVITTIAGYPADAPFPDTPTGVTVDPGGNIFTSGGWMVSPYGQVSGINARAGNVQFFPRGVGVAADTQGNLFWIIGNEILKLSSPHADHPNPTRNLGR
jgi:sugar lactone lactonase YvrE